MSKTPHVAIVGAGFGGLEAAEQLAHVTVEVTLMLSGVKFMVLSCAERAMAKQPAWAAPMSSSGFVPLPFSKRVRKE